MSDKDHKLIWESYVDETVATSKNIERVRNSLNEPDLEDGDRQMIIDVLRELEKQAHVDDIKTVKQKIFDVLGKLSGRGRINEQGGYAQIVADEERFLDVAYKYYGDMEESELKFHHYVLEELLEMDELTRREFQGQGPQRD
jgi:hypothetical protein